MNVKKTLFASLLIGLSAITTVHGQLKIATVDISLLFDQYHKTKNAQKDLNLERARVQKENDDRLIKIREIEAAMKKIKKKLDDPSFGENKKATLGRAYEEKRQEGIAFDRERREFLQRRNAALMEKTKEDMQGILKDITDLTRVVSKVDGYDFVFNKTAIGINQVPFILHSKNSFDITEQLKKTLNKNASKKK